MLQGGHMLKQQSLIVTVGGCLRSGVNLRRVTNEKDDHEEQHDELGKGHDDPHPLRKAARSRDSIQAGDAPRCNCLGHAMDVCLYIAHFSQ